MTNCDFELIDDVWKCRVCGYEYRPTSQTNPGKPPIARCRKLPSLPRRIAHYAHAVKNFVVSGSPTRTNEEVERLLVICQSCENYNSARQSCSLCGCRCTNNRLALLNKLRMATESCPVGRW